MSDLLSANDKSNIHAIFDNIHDTFARDIIIYIAEDLAFIDTDGNHNPLYGSPDEEKNEIVYTSYTKKARIKYNGEQGRFGNGAGTDAQLGISFPNGTIRLKVDSETYQLITKCRKIHIDDRLCELISSPARPGPFNPNYWTIILRQVD